MKTPHTLTFRGTLLVVLMGLFIAGFILFENTTDAFFSFVLASQESFLIAYAPLILILLPTLGAFLQAIFFKTSNVARDLFVMVTTLLTLPLILLIYPVIVDGGLRLSFPHVLGLGISFHIDMLSYIVITITAILWFLVMVFAHEYMQVEHHVKRFFFFMGLTYAAVLGTVMAGDLLTMFLFFEIMTFASYVVVTHGQNRKSYVAGYNFIFMGLMGGFTIFMGMVMIYVMTGSVAFESAVTVFQTIPVLPYVAMGLLSFGFGIKAGMAPVHVWLPRAHPVAPTPASALLSGVMIKVGAYGVLRTLTSFYFPTAEGALLEGAWVYAEAIGAVLIWIGLFTMGMGVFFALIQKNVKRLLAYSSISQMGYIMVGVGIAGYLGSYGAMGYAGALYHIVNHALFKSLLFMVAGTIYLTTKELNMNAMGGLWRKMPITASVALVAVLGIAGVPLFNGFISKSILHHGIVETYEYGHAIFRFAEIAFNVISVGTAVVFLKMYTKIFLGPMPARYQKLKFQYLSLHSAMIAIALMIVLLGLFPRFVMNRFILESVASLPFSNTFVSTYVIPLRYFATPELLLMVMILSAAGVFFFVGTRYKWFEIELPKWFKLEYILFFPFNKFFAWSCSFLYGEDCARKQKELRQVAVRNNTQVGFIDRLIYTMVAFNHRYESAFTATDAFVYGLVLVGLLGIIIFNIL
jgi:formate hydrogenlyase subunit 3/multisubunit Na+/H+ antiporter MnhD subunit